MLTFDVLYCIGEYVTRNFYIRFRYLVPCNSIVVILYY